MPYLIDGSNLIGHIPHLTLEDPRSKYRLVAQLLIFQRIKRIKIILVFDGPPDLHLIGKEFRGKKFDIIYPSYEENADTIIKTWIEKQTDLRQVYVISSDREINTFARMKGAKVKRCDEFHKELKAVLKEYRAASAMKKADTSLSPLEVNHWIKIFESKDE
jgi:predicted RNA-binding protein with PIN domain